MSRLHTAFAGLAVATALVTAPVAAGASPADRAADPPSKGSVAVAADPVQTLKNKATKRCLDDSDRGLRTLGCNGKVTQKWRVHVFGKTRRLQSVGTGLCLDDSGRGLRTHRCWNSTNPNAKFQRWFKANYSNGTIRLQSQVTRQCLDDSSRGLRTIKCWPNNNKNRIFQGWS